jgi:predicted O-methyltransferase YrrM
VTWHVDYSAAVAARWEGTIDLVFIDGDHSEAGVRADWEGWHGFVEPGGAVLFHDARLSQARGRGLPGPTAVVDSLFRGPDAVAGWRVLREADRTVAVVRAA